MFVMWIELKPCPFCGGEAKLFDPDKESPWHQVVCQKCSASTRNRNQDYKAAADWNSRTTKPVDENSSDFKAGFNAAMRCEDKSLPKPVSSNPEKIDKCPFCERDTLHKYHQCWNISIDCKACGYHDIHPILGEPPPEFDSKPGLHKLLTEQSVLETRQPVERTKSDKYSIALELVNFLEPYGINVGMGYMVDALNHVGVTKRESGELKGLMLAVRNIIEEEKQGMNDMGEAAQRLLALSDDIDIALSKIEDREPS